jgi:hypothetical protein
MRCALLGLAASAAILTSAPAPAQGATASSLTASSSGRDIRFVSPPVEVGPGRYLPGERHHHRRHGGHGGGVVVSYGYGAGGYYDYGDYDANRSFDPDRWNDWWHDRPDRAYPRWMSRNGDCARRWYSGDVLTC